MLNVFSKKPKTKKRSDDAELSDIFAEPTDRKTNISWGPVAATVWAVIVYGAPQILVGVALAIYPAIKHWNSSQTNNWLNNSISAQFIYTVIVEAIAIGIIWALLRHYRSSFWAIGLKRAKVADILYMVVGFAAYFALYLIFVGILSKLIPSLNVNQQQDVGFQSATTSGSLIMAFISLVILPPIAEEIIFRGFVFSGFRKRMVFIVSALCTSVLFAIPHLFESEGGGLLWIAAIDTFILSCVLCTLREKTGRLWSGMGVHALKNGLAFMTIFVFHVH
jgi:membrane protease YdiL (CAAX protease family)